MQNGILSKGEMERFKKRLTKITKEAGKSPCLLANNLSRKEATEHIASGSGSGVKGPGVRSITVPSPRREGDIKKPPGGSPLALCEHPVMGEEGTE